MDASEITEAAADGRRRPWGEWLAGLLLFAASAAVVVWQNSRLGVLWDASYILENSYRISLGDVPYRDFPFPYAPLTFLTQAAIIRLTGRVFWHHTVYCAAAGGVSAVLTWRILLNLLRPAVPRARWVAYALSAPLAVLGIYAVFPHPFYDPDCTLAVTGCVLLLQLAERKSFPPPLAFLAGAALVVPLFVKQNTGLAFLLSAALALAALAAVEAWHGRAARGHFWLLAGVVAALAASLLLIQLTAGLTTTCAGRSASPRRGGRRPWPTCSGCTRTACCRGGSPPRPAGRPFCGSTVGAAARSRSCPRASRRSRSRGRPCTCS